MSRSDLYTPGTQPHIGSQTFRLFPAPQSTCPRYPHPGHTLCGICPTC
jgi:hypothetical protein